MQALHRDFVKNLASGMRPFITSCANPHLCPGGGEWGLTLIGT